MRDKTACKSASSSPVVKHWLAQRLTAIALVPLSLWLVVILFSSLPAHYQEAQAWMTSWSGTLGLITLIIVLCYHTALGIQVICEDYIQGSSSRRRIIRLLKCLLFLLLLVSLGALFTLHIFKAD